MGGSGVAGDGFPLLAGNIMEIQAIEGKCKMNLLVVAKPYDVSTNK